MYTYICLVSVCTLGRYVYIVYTYVVLYMPRYVKALWQLKIVRDTVVHRDPSTCGCMSGTSVCSHLRIRGPSEGCNVVTNMRKSRRSASCVRRCVYKEGVSQ